MCTQCIFGWVPNIQSVNYLTGSQDVAADYQILKNGGITHIVNVATGIPNFFPKQFRYFTLELLDLPTTDLFTHFYTVTEWINEVVMAGGKVFSNLPKRDISSDSSTLQCRYISILHLCSGLYDEVSKDVFFRRYAKGKGSKTRQDLIPIIWNMFV